MKIATPTLNDFSDALTHWERDFFAARFPTKRAILGVFRKILPPKIKDNNGKLYIFVKIRAYTFKIINNKNDITPLR